MNIVKTMALSLMFVSIHCLADDNTKLASELKVEGQTLQLCGEVALRALGIFKFGYGGLYLADCSDSENVTGDIPKQWSVLLTRDAKGSKLTEIAENSLENNFSEQQLAALQPIFSCITSAYQDMPKGAQVDVRYIPDSGLTLLKDNTLIADCGGGAGAATYFRIWFGDKPFNRKMKKAIMQQAEDKNN